LRAEKANLENKKIHSINSQKKKEEEMKKKKGK